MIEDRNFDDIAHKFAKNIYGSNKGDIRQVIVWEDLEQIIESVKDKGFPLSIFDAGGGVAQLSRRLAALGNQVTLCDLSREMLSLAQQEIEKDGLLEHYRLIHQPVQNASEFLDKKQDLILFHAVMEWLAKPEAVLKQLTEQLADDGIISVMFYNHHGLVYKNVLCGNIPHVLEGMPHRKRFKLQPAKGLKPEDVYRWLEQSGLTIVGKSGIRCFSDYLRSGDNMGDYTPQDLMEMERQVCRQEPYISMGRYIHVWAQKKQRQE
ncbi:MULTISPECIES: tRNA uridine 5-oxyacetic acid(34) methyltransferase CmoM [unclassified Vibrio]|uniref:tRNA 5-carboxymethoxyuridine methyltransferase n=1 Tax=Vibrio sp. HB236076 TaxID=3232307 RepID=A0AB39HDQ0_9VIBR|nr:tRNA uridine 5-oxyacetic acid(34) methyltransferase CmoM [Vibrio sp. HB161653]MDP5255057.1 tRNA uridine 5-oxyacetic acid(34) methyltransferase CmoM [Vibrio sp. HB161653]